MADKDDEPEDGEEDGEEGGEPVAEGAGKKKLILIVGVALLAAIGGIGGAFYAGLFDSLLGPVKVETASDSPEKPASPGGTGVYLDLPEIVVNLNVPGAAPATGPAAAQRRGGFLKLRVSLELQKPEDSALIEQVMPRIVDSVQVYLRELRMDDLRGSAGLYRLREELLMRVVTAAQPTKVNDVLFKEMLVQ